MIESIVNQGGQMGRGGGGQSVILLWVIIVLLVIIIIYLWYNNRKNSPTISPSSEESVDMNKIEVALKLLNPSEKLVVEALIEKGGEMLQKDIHYELDLSRVQAHRIVQSLTQKELVMVEDHFNTKKVVLADWLIG